MIDKSNNKNLIALISTETFSLNSIQRLVKFFFLKRATFNNK